MTKTKKGNPQEDFDDVKRAMRQARALIYIGQEAYSSADSGEIYDFLGALDDKVQLAIGFLEENEDYLECNEKIKGLRQQVVTLRDEVTKKLKKQEAGK